MDVDFTKPPSAAADSVAGSTATKIHQQPCAWDVHPRPLHTHGPPARGIFSDPPARLLIWLKVGLRLPAEALAKHILGSRREGLLEDRLAHRVMRPGGRFWFRSPYRSWRPA